MKFWGGRPEGLSDADFWSIRPSTIGQELGELTNSLLGGFLLTAQFTRGGGWEIRDFDPFCYFLVLFLAGSEPPGIS